MREVKSRLGSSFQCDILTRLPLELACLVTQHFCISDIFVHRRVCSICSVCYCGGSFADHVQVSKKWNELLSSPLVLQSRIKTIPGKNRALPESVAGLESIIKRRWRMEYGKPAAMAKFPSDLLMEQYTSKPITYSSGMVAWIDEGRNDFFRLLCLRTGKVKEFTTENRESLIRVQVSNDLVTAVSTRGYVLIMRTGYFFWTWTGSDCFIGTVMSGTSKQRSTSHSAYLRR